MHVCAECRIAAVCKEVYFGRGNCPPCASTGGSANTTTNTGSPKLPTLKECLYESVVVNSGFEVKMRTTEAVTACYEFICRQLQADA